MSTTHEASTRASPACSVTCATPASASPISTPRNPRWKISSSAWYGELEGGHHELQGHPRDLSVRNGAHPAHAAAKHRLARDIDVTVLRGVRRGDRFTHQPRRRRQ